MEEIIKFAKEYNVPVVRPKTLELLLKTIKENNSKRVLEIGTAIGYSGAQILQNSDANLVTIEKYEAIYEIAKNNFKRLGLSNRVKQYLGDAKEVLKDLSDSGEKFDFIFLDGPKGQYLSYLPLLNNMLEQNGIIFADDVLFMNDLGFDQVSIEPVVLPDEHYLAIKEEHLPAIFAEYERLAVEYLERRKTDDKWFSFFHFVLHLNDGPCYKKRLVGCGAGSEYLAVAPNGDIYPCHQFVGEKQYLIGNVHKEGLNEEIRKKFAQSSIFSKPDCQKCWAKYHCSGGCNANAIHFNGDMDKPYKMACEMMKKRLECSMYIFAKENF